MKANKGMFTKINCDKSYKKGRNSFLAHANVLFIRNEIFPRSSLVVYAIERLKGKVFDFDNDINGGSV